LAGEKTDQKPKSDSKVKAVTSSFKAIYKSQKKASPEPNIRYLSSFPQFILGKTLEPLSLPPYQLIKSEFSQAPTGVKTAKPPI